MDRNENNNPPGIFTRLKQHHIYRVAAWYGASIAVLIQIVARAFPYFGWSAAVPAIIIILIAGFPVALVLSWLLVKPAALDNQTTWQRRHWKLGAVVVPLIIAAVVVSGIFAFRFSEQRVAAEQTAAQTEAKPAAPIFNPSSASIVVLPFTNLSGDPEQAYFSNGITEELTDALGQNTGLTVIAWGTASRYSTGKQSPAEIGRALNVAHIVDGSIQREGDQVRVSVELVSTVTGRQLWSEHYDDSFRNIFAVQDKITVAVADALKVKFAAMQGAPTQNPEAHQLYLKGLAAMDRFTAPDTQAAENYFQQAVKLDPGYADAWAGLAETYIQLSEISTLPLKEALPKIREAATKALALDPRNANALVQLGNADSRDNRISQAQAEYQQALALDPNNADGHLSYGNVLPLEQALAQNQTAARLDPGFAIAQANLAGNYQDLGDWPHAVVANLAVTKLSPHLILGAFGLAFTYTQMGRGEDAVKAFDLVQPDTQLDKQLLDTGRLTYQSLLEPRLRPKALVALDTLRHANISPVSKAYLLQLYLALGEKEPSVQMLPGICAAAPAVCNDLAISPMFTPLHGDPRFEKLAKQYTTITRDPAPASTSLH